jgi:hypothetical protein
MARSRTCKSDASASALRARARKGNLQCALGVLMAGLLFEVALRPIVVDSSRLGVRTIRNYFEGLSCAHFEADGLGEVGSRLTGNLRLSGAPEGMIIGDSHVVAYAVRDEETIGSVVERLSRTAGRPLNVRQYGWHGANSPTFLAAAESLMRARNPSWVAVVLNSYNIGMNALVIRGGWRMEVASDYSFRLIDGRPPGHGRWRQTLGPLVGHSTLFLGLGQRLGLFQTRLAQESYARQMVSQNVESALDQQAAWVPRASVLGLKRAFGGRLLVVYASQVLGPGHYSVGTAEAELQRLCAEEGVAFLSVREGLERDRNQYSRLSRGFHNTAPGVGHFNAIGHRIIGEEIWRCICDRPSPPIQGP